MSQFRAFSVRIENGQATVRAIWEVIIGSITGGPYVAGEGLTWGVDGVGLYVSDANNRLRLYRTSGAEPAQGDTLTGGTSGATAAINVIETADENGLDINPPRFADAPVQGPLSAGDMLALRVAAADAVVATVASSITRDSFDLSAAWSGATLTDVPAVVTRDFEPANGLPVPRLGDVAGATTAGEAIRRIGALLNLIGAWKTVVADSVAGYQNSWADKGGGSFEVGWRSENGRVVMRGIATLSGPTPPVLIFTLPVGDRPRYDANFILHDAVQISIGTDGQVTYESGAADDAEFSQVGFST